MYIQFGHYQKILTFSGRKTPPLRVSILYALMRLIFSGNDLLDIHYRIHNPTVAYKTLTRSGGVLRPGGLIFCAVMTVTGYTLSHLLHS